MRPLFATRIAAACLLAAATLTQAAPKVVKATYNGFINGLPIGTLNEQFERDGSAYRIVSETRPVGLAALIQRQPLYFLSTGRIASAGLQPTLFEARRSSGDAPQVSAEFDWPQKQLVLKHQSKTESLSLPPGTQDRLSVMYQFLFLTADRIRKLDFAMTNGRKLDHYQYRVSGEVEVETGLGRLKTLHLVKQREPGDTVNEVWLSPQHQHFPVKLLIVERDGMRVEQVIQSLELRD